jgi:hypothetical protein
MDNESPQSKLICRKCGGGHLTIKCNQNKQSQINNKSDTNKELNTSKPNYNSRFDNNSRSDNNSKPNYSKQSYDEKLLPYNNKSTGKPLSYINKSQSYDDKLSSFNNKSDGKPLSYNNKSYSYDVNLQSYSKNESYKPYTPFYKAKISELPKNITEEELQELLYDWGHITRIIVKAYDNAAVAYITFKNENEVDYLIRALDSTPFEYKIIHIEKIIN